MIEKGSELNSDLSFSKVVPFLLAVFSFAPSPHIMVLFNLILLGFCWYYPFKKYLVVFGALTVFSAFAALLNQYFSIEAFMLSFLMMSSLMYYFLGVSWASDPSAFARFCGWHVVFSCIQFPIQIFQIASVYGLSASTFGISSSVGDVAYGTMRNATLLADKQLISLVILFFLRGQVDNLKLMFAGIILLTSFLIIGANHALLVFFAAAALYLFLEVSHPVRIFKSYKMACLAVVGTAVVCALVVLVFESQLAYILHIGGKLFDTAEIFGKVRAYTHTVDFFIANPDRIWFGLGMGNFSSRVAFMLGGEYLWQGEMPLFGIVQSPEFAQIMLPLWNLDISSQLFLTGTANQPFSAWLTLFSEFGILFSAFVVMLSVYAYMRIKPEYIEARFLFIFAAGMMFVDNFLEYPRFIAVIAVFIGYFVELSRKNSPLSQLYPASRS